MKFLFILNDPPYGTERSYNSLRLARELLRDSASGDEVRLFLLGDASSCAHAGQKVPAGYYNVADMLGGVLRHGGEVAVCGTCMDARGMAAENLIAGAKRSTMTELAAWTRAAEKVLAF
jgi:uncharacterized protein involved in oxidation of intracellular sulfur